MILVINTGSSSIKFGLYKTQADLALYYRGQVETIGGAAILSVWDSENVRLIKQPVDSKDHCQALTVIVQKIGQLTQGSQITVVGHRVVHGGSIYRQPVMVDKAVLADLEKLIPMASLHQAHCVAAIKMMAKMRPELLQIACFDTAFHHTMPWEEQQIALDKTLLGDDIKRYGFHGLSYQSIAEKLPYYLGEEQANGRVVVAHLGAGASLCAMKNKQSIATTMGFTPLDGLVMATRCGSLDPGVLLYLQKEKKITVAELTESLMHHSGLKALSGLSGDMQILLSSTLPEAKAAVDFFVYHVARHIGAMMIALGGIDALVFTAGIGEHAAEIRDKICEKLQWLGLELDTIANQQGKTQISAKTSDISVWVLTTDEEGLIASQATLFLK
ncbi:MAG: acetate kinase [Methylophaga sp.]|nr:MAG: acetate kinase [Methylophaga sp.]